MTTLGQILQTQGNQLAARPAFMGSVLSVSPRYDHSFCVIRAMNGDTDQSVRLAAGTKLKPYTTVEVSMRPGDNGMDVVIQPIDQKRPIIGSLTYDS